MAKKIMVQGTMSNVGKSLIVAGLCRIFRQDGYKVAPFKSQNMALNSFITSEGLEMGRAQVMQAEAAGVAPSVYMNPILLKPTNDIGSQVIVNGKVLGNMSAKDYFAYKKRLVPDILSAYHELEEQADIIVIEGAGSPAEINLKADDIVNMGLAELLDAPVLLVGDIDRGGVFAQLLGTIMLLEEEEKARVKGLVVNKFRGDLSILTPGIDMLQEKSGIPVAGVVPYMELSLEDEDSLGIELKKKGTGLIDLAVIQYPRISNFTDFHVFEGMKDVSVRYIQSVAELGNPDMILLPGSKNTMGDLKWMRQNGLEAVIKKRAEYMPVWGICGGYQMLGKMIHDPDELESGGTLRGMELLPNETVLLPKKNCRQVKGKLGALSGILAELAGMEIAGYEIHMGETVGYQFGEMQPVVTGIQTVSEQTKPPVYPLQEDGANISSVYGSYVHGIFDKGNLAVRIVEILAKKKGVCWNNGQGNGYAAFKESQYDKLAQGLREHMDIEFIYGLL